MMIVEPRQVLAVDFDFLVADFLNDGLDAVIHVSTQHYLLDGHRVNHLKVRLARKLIYLNLDGAEPGDKHVPADVGVNVVQVHEASEVVDEFQFLGKFVACLLSLGCLIVAGHRVEVAPSGGCLC